MGIREVPSNLVEFLKRQFSRRFVKEPFSLVPGLWFERPAILTDAVVVDIQWLGGVSVRRPKGRLHYEFAELWGNRKHSAKAWTG